mmetsp:Transcript_51106/g.141443  ORF Transcript_51106/g.141443 Transcript_51106/m.141443 type:complete len:276 (+) Transcript_51106:491-1318(+)
MHATRHGAAARRGAAGPGAGAPAVAGLGDAHGAPGPRRGLGDGLALGAHDDEAVVGGEHVEDGAAVPTLRLPRGGAPAAARRVGGAARDLLGVLAPPGGVLQGGRRVDARHIHLDEALEDEVAAAQALAHTQELVALPELDLLQVRGEVRQPRLPRAGEEGRPREALDAQADARARDGRGRRARRVGVRGGRLHPQACRGGPGAVSPAGPGGGVRRHVRLVLLEGLAVVGDPQPKHARGLLGHRRGRPHVRHAVAEGLTVVVRRNGDGERAVLRV